jgi:hypothetical protein
MTVYVFPEKKNGRGYSGQMIEKRTQKDG